MHNILIIRTRTMIVAMPQIYFEKVLQIVAASLCIVPDLFQIKLQAKKQIGQIDADGVHEPSVVAFLFTAVNQTKLHVLRSSSSNCNYVSGRKGLKNCTLSNLISARA